MGNFGRGQAVRRVEDQRFLTGTGQYTDDINKPGQAYLYILHSPHAHADIARIDTAAAKAAPGVVGVLTCADLDALGIGDILNLAMPPDKDGRKLVVPSRPALARKRVRYVGEPVAAVIAETLAQARDASELIEVDYKELPAVAELADAVKPGAAVVHAAEAPGNVWSHWQLGDKDATAAAFAKAHKVVSIDLVNNRIAPTALEPRGAIAEYDAKTERTTLIQGSQGSHKLRDWFANVILKVPPEKVRVISPDVGGAFGMKNFLFNEPICAVVAAKLYGRPIKWTADRAGSFLNDAHGRDQVNHAELALDKDGTFLALRVSSLGNVGAYLSQFGAAIPTMAGCAMLVGAYRTPAAYVDVRVMFTNTAPVDAYRGAGRPEAAYVMERLVDKAAREMGIPAAELRRKNFIRADEFPFKTALGHKYDSGRYAELMDAAYKRADVAGFEARRAEAKKRGKLRGLGVSYYVEACAGGQGEQPHLKFEKDGKLTIIIGTQDNGQGHRTAYAQIAADMFGLPIDAIVVKQGDTDEVPTGVGTGGSRSVPVGGSAVQATVAKMIENGKALASHLLEASAKDIEFANGAFVIAGTDRKVALKDVIAASFDDKKRPAEQKPGLYASEMYAPTGSTFPNGCHICELEVDEDTGEIEFVNYTIQDDLGYALNPLMMEGQILGGAVQGLGQCLFEHAVYDRDTAQLVTGSFMDYTMPRADSTPRFKFAYTEVPTPNNALGIKGAGEAGTIGATPCVANAVIDALWPVGVRALDMPMSPLKIWQAIQAAKAKRAA
ncbi:MAG: xanthine dehydrogenase family protein molybdopterin-binding subunit [Rhodospirillaceae bacterium]|nr:xanthine dehydrogenase family protein molybdopterin-binding subunit [Rhodospirillaceae bacterium]